jgi:hypothetical protein
MDPIQCKIISEESLDTIIEKLKSITIEEQPFFKPKGILFLGKIRGDSFRLITFNSPPMEFDFKVQNGQLDFEYKKDNLTKLFKGLIYGITIPIFVGIWIWGLIDKRVDLGGKIALTFFLLLPFGFNKFFNFLYLRFILPKDDKFITRLEQRLGIKIEKLKLPNNKNA